MKIKSKYHHFTKQFESKYEWIHRKVISRFHRKPIQAELVHSNINNLITKTTENTINKIKFERKVVIISQMSTKKVDNSYKEPIDSTRARFSGKIIKIIVREGKIIWEDFLDSPRKQDFCKEKWVRFRILINVYYIFFVLKLLCYLLLSLLIMLKLNLSYWLK